MRETEFAAIVERRDGGALITTLKESPILSIYLAVAGWLLAVHSKAPRQSARGEI